MSDTHDENKLPQWARRRIADLRFEIDRLRAVEETHALLMGREWFTIGGPPGDDRNGVRHLWWLDYDQPRQACSLSHGDVLVIGRSRHRWGGSPVPIVSGTGGELRVG